jgi:glyoxylase-like metal-dependent hydrolase (beta-lactamase superfamily II)
MIIKQIKVGFDNFSYIVYDLKIKDSAIIDPSTSIIKQINFLKSKKLDLKYIINTHHHMDHTDKNVELRKLYPKAKIIISEKYIRMLDIKQEIKVNESSMLKIGNIHLKFLLTPGHTPDGLCIIVDDKAILTGDTLFIDNCGRADLTGGNLNDLFNSLQKIKQLSDNIIVYPGHNYGPKPYDNLGNQKKTNKTLLAQDLNEFSKIP